MENDLNVHLGPKSVLALKGLWSCWEDGGKDAFLSRSFVSLVRAWVPFESGPVCVCLEFRTATAGADLLLTDMYITDPLPCR